MKHIQIQPDQEGFHFQNLYTHGVKMWRGEVGEGMWFDMKNFTLSHEVQEQMTDCGPGGCSVGWATLHIEKYIGEDFVEYSQRVFIKDVTEREWVWCFESFWKNIDNTPGGAGLRILYMLERGIPEKEFWTTVKDSYTPDLKFIQKKYGVSERKTQL